MRKADYAILADVIKSIRTAPAGALPSIDVGNADIERGMKHAAVCIAKSFANRSNVNRAEFLKACGIDPG